MGNNLKISILIIQNGIKSHFIHRIEIIVWNVSLKSSHNVLETMA